MVSSEFFLFNLCPSLSIVTPAETYEVMLLKTLIVFAVFVGYTASSTCTWDADKKICECVMDSGKPFTRFCPSGSTGCDDVSCLPRAPTVAADRAEQTQPENNNPTECEWLQADRLCHCHKGSESWKLHCMDGTIGCDSDGGCIQEDMLMEEESVTVTEGATPAGEPESSPVNSGSANTTPINCVWLDGGQCHCVQGDVSWVLFCTADKTGCDETGCLPK